MYVEVWCSGGYEQLKSANKHYFTEDQMKAYALASRSQSAAEVRELRESLALVLPMAKGYARANPIGNNAVFIEQADAALNRKAAT
jgi:hypothetical protein